MTLHQNDGCLDHLTANLIGNSRNATFQNIGQFHNHILDLKGSDAVTGGLDHIVSAANIPVEAVFIFPGQVAGVIETVTPGLCGNIGTSFISETQAAGKTLGNINTNFAGLTGVNGVAVAVQKLHIVNRYGLAHRTQPMISVLSD